MEKDWRNKIDAEKQAIQILKMKQTGIYFPMKNNYRRLKLASDQKSVAVQ